VREETTRVDIMQNVRLQKIMTMVSVRSDSWFMVSRKNSVAPLVLIYHTSDINTHCEISWPIQNFLVIFKNLCIYTHYIQ